MRALRIDDGAFFRGPSVFPASTGWSALAAAMETTSRWLRARHIADPVRRIVPIGTFACEFQDGVLGLSDGVLRGLRFQDVRLQNIRQAGIDTLPLRQAFSQSRKKCLG